MLIILLVCLVMFSIIAVLATIAAFSEDIETGIGMSLIAITVLSIGWFYFAYSVNYANTSHVRECKVAEVQKVNELEQSTDSSRVYCEDGSNYEISDNFMKAYFDSSNVYNKVKSAKGKTIVVDTIGFRNGFFSSFENIIKVKEIK